MKRILVAGGRNYEDKKTIFQTLDAAFSVYGYFKLIVGDAKGADRLAAKWAKKRGLESEVFYADWRGWGANAGPMRNQLMILQGNPDFGIYFPGGRGTADMIARMRRSGRTMLSHEEALEQFTPEHMECD